MNRGMNFHLFPAYLLIDFLSPDYHTLERTAMYHMKFNIKARLSASLRVWSK